LARDNKLLAGSNKTDARALVRQATSAG
jgi:hypothetical protein